MSASAVWNWPGTVSKTLDCEVGKREGVSYIHWKEEEEEGG